MFGDPGRRSGGSRTGCEPRDGRKPKSCHTIFHETRQRQKQLSCSDQRTMEMTIQLAVAIESTKATPDRQQFHTTIAKHMSPTLPSAAPYASSPAACLPRLVLSIPAFCFFCRSCFSMSVALAGKIAGNARRKPPTTEPCCLATSPARTVAPPKRNRRAYSYLVFRRVESWTDTRIKAISAIAAKLRMKAQTRAERWRCSRELRASGLESCACCRRKRTEGKHPRQRPSNGFQ
jgi:hypothetical protein